MKTIVGIDPSLSRTAICFGPIDRPETRLFISRNQGDDVANRIERFEDLAARISRAVDLAEPGLIVIEGYSFGSKNHRAEALAEFGGLLRRRLLATCRNIFEIPPRSLKLWATGSGAADKSKMAAAILERYAAEFGTDDQVDAFAAWRFGWQLAGIETPVDESQFKVVSKFSTRIKGKRNGIARTEAAR